MAGWYIVETPPPPPSLCWQALLYPHLRTQLRTKLRRTVMHEILAADVTVVEVNNKETKNSVRGAELQGRFTLGGAVRCSATP